MPECQSTRVPEYSVLVVDSAAGSVVVDRGIGGSRVRSVSFQAWLEYGSTDTSIMEYGGRRGTYYEYGVLRIVVSGSFHSKFQGRGTFHFTIHNS